MAAPALSLDRVMTPNTHPAESGFVAPGTVAMPNADRACTSFDEVLRYRAATTPDGRAFVFLENGEEPGISLTYAQLDSRARAIAATLQRTTRVGDRVLLVYPAGLDFVVAFFACLYAGVIAVPAYPPIPSRLARTLPRFQTVAADSDATHVLTTAALAEMAPHITPLAPELAALRWIATDAIDGTLAESFVSPSLDASVAAFLQYTSGSTGVPRGVVITHGNLLHNARSHWDRVRYTPESVHVSWLPVYHDMGLINGVLQPVFSNMLGVLMPPLAFLKKPVRWLQAITRYGGTASEYPNFALDLCSQTVTPEELAALDLSTWTVAVNGAEPIRLESIDRFVEVFGPRGFRRDAMHPGYGLAECTVLTTTGITLEPLVVIHVDKEALDKGHVRIESHATGRTRPLVSCGRIIVDHDLRIVDPALCTASDEGRVGELWVRGPSVADGYWKRPDESARTFGATLAGEDNARYLRTGDLGFVVDHEVFITGRHKDLIVLRGRNVYPHDVEQALEGAHPALRLGCAAAFSLERDGEERVAVAVEVVKGVVPSDVDGIARAARARVSELCDVQIDRLVLLAQGALPKTSSGKVQRSTCRALILAKDIEVVGDSMLEGEGSNAPEEVPAVPFAAMLQSIHDQRAQMAEYVRGKVAVSLNRRLTEVGLQHHLEELGADSLGLMNLATALESDIKVPLPDTLVTGNPTVAQLAEAVFAVLMGARS